MTVDDDTLTRALADVRERKAVLEADYDRIRTELAKLRMAEGSLAAIVEGGAVQAAAGIRQDIEREVSGDDHARPARTAGRGSRGPRANSAKGRLKALLEDTGPQGYSHAELTRQLPGVAPNTLNTYLSTMVTSGEIVRIGDFYSVRSPVPGTAVQAGANDEMDVDKSREEKRSDERTEVG